MMLCAGRDLGELKYPENDLKYLYLTISKMFVRNIFNCEGIYNTDLVGRLASGI